MLISSKLLSTFGGEGGFYSHICKTTIPSMYTIIIQAQESVLGGGPGGVVYSVRGKSFP